MPTYNEELGAWGPDDGEIDSAAEALLLLQWHSKKTTPLGVPHDVLFHPLLVDRAFGSSLLSVEELTTWANQRRLSLVSQPPIEQFRFVQVEALLCAIERAATDSVSESTASSVVQTMQRLVGDPSAEHSPRWLLGADAHQQWRHAIEKAVAAGELTPLEFGSKMPVQLLGIAPASSQVEAAPHAMKPVWHAQAREIGEKWMLEQEKQTGNRPSVTAIAKHVEHEFKRLDVRGVRDDYYSAATIKREALTGISGRPANGKKQGNPPR